MWRTQASKSKPDGSWLNGEFDTRVQVGTGPATRLSPPRHPALLPTRLPSPAPSQWAVGCLLNRLLTSRSPSCLGGGVNTTSGEALRGGAPRIPMAIVVLLPPPCQPPSCALATHFRDLVMVVRCASPYLGVPCQVAIEMGFSLDCGRLDVSAHPFTARSRRAASSHLSSLSLHQRRV